MIGLPMNQLPYFPADEKLILLTEQAKFDSDIVDKIKKQLVDGKTVVITAGLLRELQNKGINQIAEIKYTDRKAVVQDFVAGRGEIQSAESPIIIQQLQYLTNDSWEIVSGLHGTNGWPLLHEADYGKGRLYVLVIPDNFADLYKLPNNALNKIRGVLCNELPVSLEGPANIALYLYNDSTFIVQSFLDKNSDMAIVTSKEYSVITDLNSKETFNGEIRKPSGSWTELNKQEKNSYTITLKPHSFKVFKME
jgi:hypothetical protein